MVLSLFLRYARQFSRVIVSVKGSKTQWFVLIFAGELFIVSLMHPSCNRMQQLVNISLVTC